MKLVPARRTESSEEHEFVFVEPQDQNIGQSEEQNRIERFDGRCRVESFDIHNSLKTHLDVANCIKLHVNLQMNV